MNYKSYAALTIDVRNWIKELSHDYDLIVGVPRSGILPANIITLYKNLPMTDVNGLIERRLFSSGRRLNVDEKSFFDKKNLKVLIIDDSVNTGSQIKKVKDKINSSGCDFDIDYAAVYASKKGINFVDKYYQILPQPRIFEWNIFHRSILEKSCVDIDGLLCRDPTKEENDDGPVYKRFIQTVAPLIKPTKKIGWIVSCRLEKYRTLTEAWLKENHIKYDNLMLMDLPDKESRIRSGNHAKYKAEIYKETNARLFIESSSKQAREIAKRSGKFVYCFEENRMISPYEVRSLITRIKDKIRRIITKTLKFYRK